MDNYLYILLLISFIILIITYKNNPYINKNSIYVKTGILTLLILFISVSFITKKYTTENFSNSNSNSNILYDEDLKDFIVDFDGIKNEEVIDEGIDEYNLLNNDNKKKTTDKSIKCKTKSNRISESTQSTITTPKTTSKISTQDIIPNTLKNKIVMEEIMSHKDVAYDYSDIMDKLVCFITTFDKNSYNSSVSTTVLNDYTKNERNFSLSTNNTQLVNQAIYMKNISVTGPHCNELGIDANKDYSISFYINFNTFNTGELFRLYGNVTTNIIMKVYVKENALYIDYNGNNTANNTQSNVITSLLRIDFTEINFLFTITKTNDSIKIYKNNILKDDISISVFDKSISFSNSNITLNYNNTLDFYFYSLFVYNKLLKAEDISILYNLQNYIYSVENSKITLPTYKNGELYSEYKCVDQISDTRINYEKTMNNYYNLLNEMTEKNNQINELIDLNNSHQNRLTNINSVTYLNNVLKEKVAPHCIKVDPNISLYKQRVTDECKQSISDYCKQNPTAVGCLCSDPQYKNLPDCIQFNKFLLTSGELKKKEKILEIKCPSQKKNKK